LTLALYLTFICLVLIVSYYFIYLNNINKDNLFTIILNFTFLIILPIFYFYFKDIIYSLLISLCLLISSLSLNKKIYKTYYYIKLASSLYIILINYIFLYLLTKLY